MDIEPDPTNWDIITSENEEEDPIKGLLEKSKTVSGPIKRGRGRPKKSSSMDAPPEFLPAPSAPAPAPPEEQLSNAELVAMFMKEERPPTPTKPRKSSLKFSGDSIPNEDNDEVDPDDPERKTLLNMYKMFFRPPLIDKHKRKEKIWTESNLTSEIHREVRKLQSEVAAFNPADVLAGYWVISMGMVEGVGPMFDLKTQGLTYAAAKHSQDEGFRSTMRDLLIKYPWLRVMIGLGGLPEFNLLAATYTLVKSVHDMNSSPNVPVPDDLRTAYSEL